MSKFLKTLIASVLAVAVAGPATADVNKTGAYKGSKTTLSVKPVGCPNSKEKDIQTQIGFGVLDEFRGFDIEFPLAGCWGFTAVKSDDELILLGGLYIERKVGKQLTMSLTGPALLDGAIDEINQYLLSESKCDYSLVEGDIDPSDFFLKKGNGLLSKNGERFKLELQVEGKYTNDSGETKKVKAMIKGKLDYDPIELNLDCGEILPEA